MAPTPKSVVGRGGGSGRRRDSLSKGVVSSPSLSPLPAQYTFTPAPVLSSQPPQRRDSAQPSTSSHHVQSQASAINRERTTSTSTTHSQPLANPPLRSPPVTSPPVRSPAVQQHHPQQDQAGVQQQPPNPQGQSLQNEGQPGGYLSLDALLTMHGRDRLFPRLSPVLGQGMW